MGGGGGLVCQPAGYKAARPDSAGVALQERCRHAPREGLLPWAMVKCMKVHRAGVEVHRLQAKHATSNARAASLWAALRSTVGCGQGIKADAARARPVASRRHSMAPL